MASGSKRQSSTSTQQESKKSRMSNNEPAKKTRSNAKQADASADTSTDPNVVAIRKWAHEYCAKVRENESEMIERLDKIKGKLEAAQQAFGTGMISIFRQALLPIEAVEVDKRNAREDARLKVEVTAAGHQPLCDRIADLLGASNDLITHYETLTTEQSYESRLHEVRDTFKKDKQAALATIAAGRKVVTNEVQNMLVDRYHEFRERANITKEEDVKGRMLLAKAEVGYEGDVRVSGAPGWGAVALDMKKGVDKLGSVLSTE